MFDSEGALLDVCVNSAISSCRNMTNEQLSELLQSDSRIDTIIDGLPQVRSMPSEREVGLTENKTLAEWNLAQEPRLEQLREQVKSAHANASALKTEVEQMKAKLDAESGGRSLDVTSNLLQVAAQEVDDDAEALAREFNSGNVAADVFLKDFHEKKTLAHLRKIKSDRLMTLLREQQYAQPMPVPRAAPMGGGALPYPDITPNARHAFF